MSEEAESTVEDINQGRRNKVKQPRRAVLERMNRYCIV